MSTTDEHGNNVGYGGTSGSCNNGVDAMGVATIDGFVVGKVANVEDSGAVRTTRLESLLFC